MAALLGPWPARGAWAALPVTVGPALGEALADRSAAVARTASLLAWGLWAVGLLAVAIPRTVSLTALRVLAPTAAAVAVWAAVAGEQRGADVVAAAWGAVVLLTACAPQTGDAFADGSSYGAERRMLLRPPLALLVGPVELVWAATVSGPIAGALLLAAQRWVAGALVLAVAGPVSFVGVRAIHGLSRRWVVFVPAGLVIHDPYALAEPVLFPRATVARLGPVPAGEPAQEGTVDVSLGAVGLRLQLDLREPLVVGPRRGRRALDLVEVSSVRFAPSRPGALLREATERRIAVG